MSTRLERWAPTATKTASKPPSSPLGREVLDRVPAGHPHAQRRDPVHLAAQDVAGHPVCRDAVAHHPAGLGAGVADLDLVAEPGQVVGGRQPARPGADDEHPLAGARPAAGRTPIPAPTPGRPGTARPSGSTRRCRDWRGCRRSRTGGSRPARGSPGTDCRPPARATPARGDPPWCAPARPGCSRPPGSRRCTGAAGRRRPGGAHAPVRCASARGPGREAASGPVACRSCRHADSPVCGHHRSGYALLQTDTSPAPSATVSSTPRARRLDDRYERRPRTRSA